MSEQQNAATEIPETADTMTAKQTERTAILAKWIAPIFARVKELERRASNKMPLDEKQAREKALEETLQSFYRTLGYMHRVWEMADHSPSNPTVNPTGTHEVCDPCLDGTCPPCVDALSGKDYV